MRPLVSAVMLTYNRLDEFKRSFHCFLNQTYENKQLVIVDSGDEEYQGIVDAYIDHSDEDIVHVCVEKQSLGNLRNIGIDSSHGEYLIGWDDDDIHHPARIEKQIEPCLTSDVDGTLLRNFIAFYEDNGRQHNCVMGAGVPGTLLIKKSVMCRYDDIPFGEDTTVIQAIKNAGNTIMVVNEPYELYQYVYHNNNTVSRSHFTQMVFFSKKKKLRIK